MMNRTYLLKNMVSKSCLQLVQLTFTGKEGITLHKVKMGLAELEIDPDKIDPDTIPELFEKLGFPVLSDPDAEIVERIKVAAIELIHKANNVSSLIRNSDYISDRVQMPYDKISKVFSKVTGTTLEKYIILLKIEKAKELIANNEFTLSEISYMLGYSSVQYLSNQFKKTTGITVSEFKDNPSAYRRPIEELLD